MDRTILNKNLNIVILTLLLMSAVLLVRPVLLMNSHMSLSYNEGWNAYLADMAVNGKSTFGLYPERFSSVTNNYPPLSFLIVGYVGRGMGDMIVAGRLINAISIICTATLIYLIVSKLTNAARPSAIAALSFFVYSATVFWKYFAIDDPQWMAECIMLSGLYICLSDPGRLRNIILAAFLMVCAGFTKHNQVAIPLSTGVYLLIKNRRSFYGFVLFSICFLTLFFIISYLEYSGNFFIDVLENKRIINFRESVTTYKKLPEVFPLFFCIYFLIRYEKLREPESALIISFSIISFTFGLIQSLAEGVNYNCFFDFLIVGCLALGIFLARQTESVTKGKWTSLKIVCLIFCVFIFAFPIEMARSYKTLSHLKQAEAFYAILIGDIRSANGNVACQDLAFCYWAGKKEMIDFFNTQQKLQIYGQNRFFPDEFRKDSVSLIEMSEEDRSLVLERYFTSVGYAQTSMGRGVFFFEK